ncbi:trypsin-like serine peptidase [Paenibacillus donghaensis]|uniref:Serine protease n=1 Tax=Paenibacillus donghaensis TaxID=414771 RepID=A0A2Z2KJ84_9BACL|nr:serine protease [Paenibacillus donghaensis]ASA23340.1 hypothetical protein B9T62_22555 [Paenibacillus donghaensis]
MISPAESISLVGNEYALPKVNPLSPADFRELVRDRAITILGAAPVEAAMRNDEELRRETEVLIQEKQNGQNNLVPVSFLSDGVARAKAVCRIMCRNGAGTGFLMGNGLLMTNHHVLPSIDEAELSFAEFSYEAGSSSIRINLKPMELFITSPFEELDYTIVSCEMKGIESITPIKLLKNTSTITRGEFVNIIQHPRGREKEVALQDNTVSYVYDIAVHYTTDTEKGSSGAAVFNNQWQLVALHHAALPLNGEAVNEGIRISAIVKNLTDLAAEGDAGAERVLAAARETAPTA